MRDNAGKECGLRTQLQSTEREEPTIDGRKGCQSSDAAGKRKPKNEVEGRIGWKKWHSFGTEFHSRETSGKESERRRPNFRKDDRKFGGKMIIIIIILKVPR